RRSREPVSHVAKQNNGVEANGEAGKLRLSFEGGTLLVDGLAEDGARGLPGLKHDPRTGRHRAEAIWYRNLVQHLLDHAIPFEDQARSYGKTPWPIRIDKPAFPHQTEGLAAWNQAGKRGVV